MSTLFVKWYELVIVSDDVLDYVNIWQEYVHNSFNIFVENKKSLCYNQIRSVVTVAEFAVVAELAYALDSGSSPRKWVGVQVPSTAS